MLKATALSQYRWAREHLYALLVLGPVVLGMGYATLSRFGESVAALNFSAGELVTASAIFVLCLVLLSLSRASAELFHIRQPESYFDALPIPADVFFQSAVAGRLLRTFAAGLAILLVRPVFFNVPWLTAASLQWLALFVVLVALVEVYAALNWIHWGHSGEKGSAIKAIFIVGLTSALGGFALAFLFAHGRFPAPWGGPVFFVGGLWAALLYVYTRKLHRRWRDPDMEYARRLEAASRRSFSGRTFLRRFEPAVAASLTRDLTLTVRGFSSAVYVVWGIVGLFALMMVAVLTTGLLPPAFDVKGWFDKTWLPSMLAIKLACVAGTVSVAALLPVVVAYELPHLWLERATGALGIDMWKAKLWYARLVTLPVPFFIWAVGVLSILRLPAREAPIDYALPLLLECIWIWWLASSVAGSLAFEMPERPGLAIVMILVVGGAAGIFSAMLWPFGVIIYFQIMHSLSERGRERARYYLITEGD